MYYYYFKYSHYVTVKLERHEKKPTRSVIFKTTTPERFPRALPLLWALHTQPALPELVLPLLCPVLERHSLSLALSTHRA